MKNFKVPRWYQDLSTPQMEMIFALRKLMKRDHEEKITDRTQKALRDIGITSTFVEIKPRDIRNLWIVSDLDPVRFLCEIYRFITGKSFEEETYKKFYDCNERIVLSCIAFLTLPDTIIELNRRLPLGKVHKIPLKPIPPKVVHQKINEESPYLEYPTARPNWRSYQNELKKWSQLRKERVNPRIILPAVCRDESENLNLNITNDFFKIKESPLSKEKESLEKKGQSTKSIKSKTSAGISSLDFSKISEISSKRSKTVRSEKSKTLQSDRSPENTMIELEDEDTIDPGEMYQDDIESYVAELPKKTYPPGRHNLSPKWQDFLLETDEDFGILEKEANIILKSVRESTNKIFNSDVCDGCCACRQIREIDNKTKESKHPNLVIDNVIAGDTGKRYLVGSLGITSPAETISDTSLNKPLIIPSEDEILKSSVIDAITLNDRGQPIPITSGISKQISRIPERVLQKPPLPRKNVPSCTCKSSDPEGNSKSENPLPCTHEETICTAKKYRKEEFNKCRKCNESSDNQVFIEFERKFRERERIEEEKKKNRYKKSRLKESVEKIQAGPIVVDEQEETEKCKMCSNSSDKCQRSPFKDVLNRLTKEKETEGGKKKPKKSGVKEYRENLKFSLGGVVSNDVFLLAGVTLHTPITITPVSSEPEIDVSAYDHHYHWSVTKFVPTTPRAPKKIAKLSPQKKRDAGKQRGGDSNQKIDAKIEELFDRIKNIDVISETTIIKEGTDDVETIQATESVRIEKNPKKVNVKNKEDDSGVHYDKQDGIEKKEKEKGRKKKNLSKLMKEALKEMAEAGYLFAKLPECHKIPPLQTWILYRRGFKMTEKIKKRLLANTQRQWEACEANLYKKIKAPPMILSEAQRSALTWDQKTEIMREIALKKKKFYSSVRKTRVLQSRAMWNLMYHNRNPNVNFKKSYFLYQASKENDGYLLKPYGFKAA